MPMGDEEIDVRAQARVSRVLKGKYRLRGAPGGGGLLPAYAVNNVEHPGTGCRQHGQRVVASLEGA
jgi:hypothetical protein